MKIVCLECYEIYNSKYLGGKFCPKAFCDGDLVELDDLMLYPIIELNKKGYRTEFCCSGHTYKGSSNPYIRFAEALPEEIHPPKGWYIDKEDPYRTTIRAFLNKKNSTKLENYNYILTKNGNLAKWVDDLKSLYNMEENPNDKC